jgi:hypothetical protein
MTADPVTPARLRELVAEAEALAAAIDQVKADLRADDSEPRRRSAFRLDEAAGQIRRAAEDLEETAGDLARIASVQGCAIPWGVCPEHGNTLTSSGGRSWCRFAGCGREWNYNRGGLPCAEPVAWHVVDQEGTGFDACAGHAIAIRKELIGARMTQLASGEQYDNGSKESDN